MEEIKYVISNCSVVKREKIHFQRLFTLSWLSILTKRIQFKTRCAKKESQFTETDFSFNFSSNS